MTVDRRTAYHEAAHAVAVFLFGGRVTYVSALEDATRWGGICSWTDSLPAVQAAVVAYIGRLAEARSTKAGARATPMAGAPPGERPDVTLTASEDTTSEGDLDAADARSRVQRNHDKWGTASTDEDCAFDCIADITSSLEETQAMLDMIRLRARALVRDEKFQFLLDHLAGVLLDRGHLDGDTAMDELARCELRLDSARSAASRESTAGQD